MKKLSIFKKIFASAVLLLLIFSGLYFLYITQFKAKKMPFQLGYVERQDLIQKVTVAGKITPLRKTLITAPYNGYVKKIYVKIGQMVKPGDPIVTIVPSLHTKDKAFPMRAPFAGKVVQIPKSEGEYVTTSGDINSYIVRIDDLSKLYVEAKIPEIDINKTKLEQSVLLKTNAVLNKTYNGIIKELALASIESQNWNENQVQYIGKVEIIDPDEKLRPGMTVILDIIAKKLKSVLTLPHEFVFKEEGHHFIYLKNGLRRNIEVGEQNEFLYEIIDGLNEGDEVRQIDFIELLNSSSNEEI